MSNVKEVDAIADFRLTLDHFYSLLKMQIGNLQSNQYIQLQASALPLDVSKNYTWFSYNILTNYFDVSIDPSPVSDSLVLNPNSRLSQNFRQFAALALTLVERKELDPAIIKEIETLEAEIGNLDKKITELEINRLAKWEAHCKATMTDRGDIVRFTHWSNGEPSSAQIYQLREDQMAKVALQTALRDKQYSDPNHKMIADSFGRILSSASRIRYPRYPDPEYGDEAKKFSVVYFASLPDNESSLFTNNYIITPDQTLNNIAHSSVGKFSSKVMKQSQASDKISEDWNGSVGASYGPFSMKANVSSHTAIKEDFKSLQSIEVGARSFMAIKMAPGGWFTPQMFDNPIISKNRRLFERFLGAKGTLLYYPTHLIVARGIYIKFISNQDWSYDYERDFSTGGSASARVFGISFGGSAGYSKHEKRQRIEKRGHELTLDDGEENIRILGYIVTKNAGFLNYQIREYEDLMVHFSREIKESSSDGKESATAKSKSKSKS